VRLLDFRKKHELMQIEFLEDLGFAKNNKEARILLGQDIIRTLQYSWGLRPEYWKYKIRANSFPTS